MESDPWLPQIFEVTETGMERSGVVCFKLSPVNGRMPEFLPGQFNMLYSFGKGEIPISISGHEKDYFHHTIASVGAVSDSFLEMKKGTKYGLRGPFGTAWPLDRLSGRHVVVMAGGLGLAPLRGVVQHLLELLERNDIPDATLFVGARSPGDLIFVDQMDEWKSKGLNVEISVDHATPEWKGHVGVITKLIPRLKLDPSKTVAMICGPEIMMRFCAEELIHREVPARNIYVSLERNMKCAIGFCGHCQLSSEFICKQGPVFSYERVAKIMRVAQL